MPLLFRTRAIPKVDVIDLHLKIKEGTSEEYEVSLLAHDGLNPKHL